MTPHRSRRRHRSGNRPNGRVTLLGLPFTFTIKSLHLTRSRRINRRRDHRLPHTRTGTNRPSVHRPPGQPLSGHRPPHAWNTAASANTVSATHTINPVSATAPLPLPSPQLPPPRSVACMARLSRFIRHADQVTAMSTTAAGAPALKSYSHACIIRQNGRSSVWRRPGRGHTPAPALQRGATQCSGAEAKQEPGRGRANLNTAGEHAIGQWSGHA